MHKKIRLKVYILERSVVNVPTTSLLTSGLVIISCIFRFIGCTKAWLKACILERRSGYVPRPSLLTSGRVSVVFQCFVPHQVYNEQVEGFN